jgi:hypothetical protein
MVWLAQMKLSIKPITDLSEAANTQGGLCSALFLPDTKDILEQRDVMSEEHDAQENLAYLELDAQKLGRANTRVLCTKNIYHRSTVEGGCANITAASLTLVDYDSEATEGHNIPFIHRAARRIALVMSSVAYRRHQERSSNSAKLNYYMFGVLDRAITHMARLLKNEPSIAAAAEESIDKIQLECVVLADKVIETGLAHMLNVISGAEEVENSLIYSNSDFNRKSLAKHATTAAKRQREKNEEYNTDPPPKVLKTDRPGKQKQSGPIIWKGGGSMPMPEHDAYPKGEKPCCAGTVKDNTWGCGSRGKCDLDHAPHDEWSKPKATFMQKFVKSTANMWWNKEIVSDEWLGKNLGNPLKDQASTKKK